MVNFLIVASIHDQAISALFQIELPYQTLHSLEQVICKHTLTRRDV